ncbi:unnamed protein product, partial [Rotaria magnacalcarata]
MNNNNFGSSVRKSLSLDELNIQVPDDIFVLTSTKNSGNNFSISKHNNGRKAILPTPNRPKNVQNLLINNNKEESSVIEQSVVSKDNRSNIYDDNKFHLAVSNVKNKFRVVNPNCHIENTLVSDESKRQNKSCDVNNIDNMLMNEIYKKANRSNRLIKNQEETDVVINHFQREEDASEEDFDLFVMQNFIAFSGGQSVIEWIEETEHKFKQLRIGRSLRFAAIFLLVEGEAKMKYLKHREEIRSIEDFYAFLLSHYENFDHASSQSKSCQTITDNSYVLTSSSHQITSTKDSIPVAINNNNPVRSTSQSAMFDSTRVIGEKSVDKSAIVLDNSSSSLFDQTLNDLRKAIVENLIKNPKVFKGGKDDVKKWIEEIEHLFEVAHIPDPIRLDLISYSLRDDAREWFRNNRSSFSSWNIFVDELKRAFTSSFIGELAFKKLESYSQGTNQSIRNYFNEVLKLCKEADDTMSESTKLKNLLNKTKPSIQLEIRKKKPTSTKEFLYYAKEVEELMQLSEMTVNNTDT